MKILLFGCNGQIGREIAEIAEQKNIDVIKFDKNACDISNFESVSKIINEHSNAQYVINAAAYTMVDKAETEQELCTKVNFDGVKNLAIATAKYNLPMFHISTDYVFDGKATSPYSENSKTNPLGVYGKSKLLGDEFLMQTNSKHLILRVSWIFGKYGNNFVKTILRLSAEKEELKIVDDQVGCPTAAVDVATAIIKMIEHNVQSNTPKYGLYHFSSTPSVSWYGFAKKIIELQSKQKEVRVKELLPIQSHEYKTLAERPKYSILNNSKLKNDFGLSDPNWEHELQNIISKRVFSV